MWRFVVVEEVLTRIVRERPVPQETSRVFGPHECPGEVFVLDEPAGHGQYVPDGDALLPLVVQIDFREQLNDRLVEAVEQAVPHGEADQSGDDALGYRVDAVIASLVKSAEVLLVHDVA